MPGYGYRPSLGDIRDHKLRFAPHIGLPSSVDLRTTGFMPDIWDQGDLGSCVPHGVDAAYAFDLAKQGAEHNWNGSKLFLYYNGRVRENTVNEDSGLTITDGIKSLNALGTAPAEDWPYNIARFTERPPQKAYDDGKLREAVKYARVSQYPNDMRACLAAGTPFVIGFTVYDSFESGATARNGVMTMPKTTEGVIGGHCIVAVGYIGAAELSLKLNDDTNIMSGTTYYIMRNSWGTGWGDNGYCYMPEAYLTSTALSGDFWTVQSVSSPSPAPPEPDPVPTPQPQPTPPAPIVIVDQADHALWTATKSWARACHVTSNRAAARAVLAWAKAKGLS